MSEALRQLASVHGIAGEYHDIWGTLHRVGDETLRALLHAMGVDASSDRAAGDALQAALRARWRRVLDPANVVRDDRRPWSIVLRLPQRFDRAPLSWRIVAEDGRASEAAFDPATLPHVDAASVDGGDHVARLLTLDASLPCGYHCLAIRAANDVIGDGALIVTPARCHSPPMLADGRRAWGVAVQLYGLRSRTNWGSGDFSDLRALAARCGSAGASIVGINPLHARNVNDPAEASPYAASSRLFIDPQYLDVEAIADLAECEEARARCDSRSFQGLLRRLRDGELVDRAGAAVARNAILAMLYASFRRRHLANGSARAEAFRRFRDEGGDALARHAAFDALREHFHRRDAGMWGWPAWPAAYRDPGSPEVARFCAAHVERVEYFVYLQWQADLQLAAASNAMGASSIGLYRDLAVSVDRGGAEAWTARRCFADGASVGAPPDDFSLLGQDWGIAPWVPARLAEDAYAPFIAVLRANMRHAGALRIDHVMALRRLFWIPPGRAPADGAYVDYPLRDMLGIVALESERNRCLIIGEDLGTVPDDVRAALADAGVLSYDVLYFERRRSGDFKSPPEYDAQALAVATTHDLPTLAGWWRGRDLELRDALGLFPNTEVRDRQFADRARDRARLLHALHDAHLLPAGVDLDPASCPAMTAELARAIHVYLARTPAKLVAVQLDDIVGAFDQTNLPGTTTQPNWRRKLPVALEDLEHDDRFAELAERMAQERPTRAPT